MRASLHRIPALLLLLSVLASEGIEGLGWGLGMSVLADAEASVLAGHDGDFGWAGYFGTTFFISPATG
ncbi:MAG: hypothetical protein OXC05_11800 [Halieaceae bacterium]|nr:hypothetical protein [Halieaceae bacterium]